MARTGDRFKQLVCDKLKNKFSESQTYTSNDLIDLMRNDPDFLLEDCVSWFLAGISDWYLDNNTATIDMVKTKLNTFLQNNPSPTGKELTITTCLEYDQFLEYFAPMTASEMNQLKQDLLDVFYN